MWDYPPLFNLCQALQLPCCSEGSSSGGSQSGKGCHDLGASEPKPHNGAATLTDTVAAAVSALTFRYPPPSDHSELGDCSPPSSARGIRQWLAVSSGFCLRLCLTLLPAISEVSQGAIARLPPHQQPKAGSPGRSSNFTPTDRISSALFQRTGSDGTGFS